MMYKSQFRKIDSYDWFCGPGLHMSFYTKVLTFQNFNICYELIFHENCKYHANIIYTVYIINITYAS